MKILYEDKYLLVCEKPVGVESQVSSSGKENMISLLENYRKEQGEDSYVGLVHRLDTATGGAMIYSKRKDVTGKLCEAIQTEAYEKQYLAVVEGRPDSQSGELCDLLYHDKQKNKSFVVKKKRAGVKEALATYELSDSREIEGGRVVSLVRVKLITGRTHQIRVQFASRGMSLLGDGKYGNRDNAATLALWSNTIEFEHPITKQKVCVQSTPPDEYPWNTFEI